jgi:hypothetical protein
MEDNSMWNQLPVVHDNILSYQIHDEPYQILIGTPAWYRAIAYTRISTD